MKLVFRVLTCCLLSGLAPAQRVATPEELIATVIESGFWQGHDAKVIGGMGDAAAVGVTKVLAGRPLKESDIESVLLILNYSFGDLSLVQVAADREPRTALFVLLRLDAATSNPILRAEIAATRKEIEERWAKAKRPPVSK
jgi:hypothetical protein